MSPLVVESALNWSISALAAGFSASILPSSGHRSRDVEHQRDAHAHVAPVGGRGRPESHVVEAGDTHEVGHDGTGAVEHDACRRRAARGRVGRGDRDALRVRVVIERVEIVARLGVDLRRVDGARREILRQHQRGRVECRLHRCTCGGGAGIVDRRTHEGKDRDRRKGENDRDVAFALADEPDGGRAKLTEDGCTGHGCHRIWVLNPPSSAEAAKWLVNRIGEMSIQLQETANRPGKARSSSTAAK